MSNPLPNSVISKMFLAFDRDVFDLIPVMWDPINFIYFDPISEKEYDFPWVFKSDEDAAEILPDLIDEEIKDLRGQMEDLARSCLHLTVTQYRLQSLPLFYYVNETALTIRVATAIGKDQKHMIDIISKKVITKPCNFHDNIEEAQAELDDIKCQRI